MSSDPQIASFSAPAPVHQSRRREMLAGSGWEGLEMSLVHQCSRQGCRVLTMGEFCIQHEPPPRPAQAVAARVDVKTATGGRLVRRPTYSPSRGNGQA
jgi:hypothetical protein